MFSPFISHTFAILDNLLHILPPLLQMEGLTFWDLTDKNLGVMHMSGNFMSVTEKSIRSYKP